MIDVVQPTVTDRDRVHRMAQRYAKNDDLGVTELMAEIGEEGRITEALLAACAQIHRPLPSPEQTTVLRQRAAFLWESFLMAKVGAGDGAPQVMAELVRSTQLDGHLVPFVYELMRTAYEVQPDLRFQIGRLGYEGLRHAQALANAAVEDSEPGGDDDAV